MQLLSVLLGCVINNQTIGTAYAKPPPHPKPQKKPIQPPIDITTEANKIVYLADPNDLSYQGVYKDPDRLMYLHGHITVKSSQIDRTRDYIKRGDIEFDIDINDKDIVPVNTKSDPMD